MFATQPMKLDRLEVKSPGFLLQTGGFHVFR
jgi:hypothetical protein